MSAHLTIPRNDEVQSDTIDLIPNEPPALPGLTVAVGTKSRDGWLGILGLIGVLIILGLSLYSVVRYLF